MHAHPTMQAWPDRNVSRRFGRHVHLTHLNLDTSPHLQVHHWLNQLQTGLVGG